MNKPTVVVEPLKDDSERLTKQIIKASQEIGLDSEARSVRKVFIKPNLTYPEYKQGVTTRRELVSALIAALVLMNPELNIYVGEGEGGYNSFSMDDAFAKMGYAKLQEEFPQVSMVNLSKVPAKKMTLDTAQGPYNIELPAMLCEEIDFSISCPVPKVHCMTKITLSYKNLWGCIPDTFRLKNHYMFDCLISKIADVLKFKYAFLCGKYGLDTNGPMVGDPVEINWFAASNSLGAFDRVVSKMMGFDWEKVGHLKKASEYGFIPERNGIKVIGDPDRLKRKFVLKRESWNYPALIAFHSRWLTHLFYFSVLSKPLHDIMYMFRKRPM